MDLDLFPATFLYFPTTSRHPRGRPSYSLKPFKCLSKGAVDFLVKPIRSNVNQPRHEAAIFKSSIDIQPEWNMLDQISFLTFSKLSFSLSEPKDLLLCGSLEYYDRSYDHVTPKNERRLERFKYRNFFKVTTTDDPVIRRLANEDKATLFATDAILATLMCAPSVVDVNNQRSFFTLNALNEFDSKYSGADWRQKLETQRDAVLATELKNNANKLAKWTTQALLESADLMKLGYVSRVHPHDHCNHVILAVIGYKPRDFATQINLGTANLWGIVDLYMKLNEGKYMLVKDPSKPQVRIYEVPPDPFENDYVEEPLREGGEC
ncbi:hypothetical protein Patl1_15912 [Pistacia atlantica]|uniref:Uncharacterized protein n=1 Tax=Pistacia atlantica TaxID=434234 RepID=A0ACC1B7L0_9ROSI|nr:hypothetical protein Patl1_15912 [Pistacia atlantica]